VLLRPASTPNPVHKRHQAHNDGILRRRRPTDDSDGPSSGRIASPHGVNWPITMFKEAALRPVDLRGDAPDCSPIFI
jgi:hypothetical protein